MSSFNYLPYLQFHLNIGVSDFRALRGVDGKRFRAVLWHHGIYNEGTTLRVYIVKAKAMKSMTKCWQLVYSCLS